MITLIWGAPTENTSFPISAFYQTRITIKAYERGLFLGVAENTDLERGGNLNFLDKTWGKIHNLSLYYQEIQAV